MIEYASLLDHLKDMLRSLGSKQDVSSLPARDTSCAALEGVKIVMVDDGLDLIDCFAADLMVATDGHASFVHFKKGDDEAKLLSRIFAAEADVVLMDYHLSPTLKGPAVIRGLRGQNFSGAIIGFSAHHDEKLTREFMAAGAIGCVDKMVLDAHETMQNLAALLAARPDWRPGH